jgi:hypothetical protein
MSKRRRVARSPAAILAAVVLLGVGLLLRTLRIDKAHAIIIAKLAMAISERPAITALWHAEPNGDGWLVGAIRVTSFGPNGTPRFTAQSTRLIRINRYGLVVGYSGGR